MEEPTRRSPTGRGKTQGALLGEEAARDRERQAIGVACSGKPATGKLHSGWVGPEGHSQQGDLCDGSVNVTHSPPVVTEAADLRRGAWLRQMNTDLSEEANQSYGGPLPTERRHRLSR